MSQSDRKGTAAWVPAVSPGAELKADLERVVEAVSNGDGPDLRGYKRTTLYRRIRKRMAEAACSTVDEYLTRLETDPFEPAALVDTILINVTEFFRSEPAWEILQRECLAPLLARRAAGEPIRCWSVGCATGEEAYTLAICLAELAGDPAREIKIYATDLDERALAAARAGIYHPDPLRGVSPERLERFFEPLGDGSYQVRRELRSGVIFGRHNALEDPPISRLDVLVCRNLLIYFDSEAQRQLLSRFEHALRNDGYLFLGQAETRLSRSTRYRPIDARHRIFQKTEAGPLSGRPAPQQPVWEDGLP